MIGILRNLAGPLATVLIALVWLLGDRVLHDAQSFHPAVPIALFLGLTLFIIISYSLRPVIRRHLEPDTRAAKRRTDTFALVVGIIISVVVLIVAFLIEFFVRAHAVDALLVVFTRAALHAFTVFSILSVGAFLRAVD